jgi:hypothetical protein
LFLIDGKRNPLEKGIRARVLKIEELTIFRHHAGLLAMTRSSTHKLRAAAGFLTQRDST